VAQEAGRPSLPRSAGTAGSRVAHRSQARPPLSIDVIRAADCWYVLRGSRAFPVDAELPSTAMLIAKGLEAVRAAASATAGDVPADGLSLLSPVTTPCRVVAQAVNYRSHARESGFGEDPPAVFFRKSSASISGPTGEVVRPAHVRLLDYEIELGLVMGRSLGVGTNVRDADLPGQGARPRDAAHRRSGLGGLSARHRRRWSRR